MFYWKKRALKAERDLKYAQSSARCAEALRQEDKCLLQELSNAIGTMFTEALDLRRTHEKDLATIEALQKEIEDLQGQLQEG